MTTGEPQSDRDDNPPATSTKRKPFERIRDWFWCGPELARLHEAWPKPSARESVFAQRARATAELTDNMLGSGEPSELTADGSACELFRQSSYWSLSALLVRGEPTFQSDDSERVWSRLDDELLVRAASSEARVEKLRSALRSGSFVYFAEQTSAEQATLLKELRKLARALLVKIAERSAALDRLYLKRFWRLSLLGLLALCVAMTPALTKKVLESRAAGAGISWRASSKLDAVTCTSPAQRCAESPNFFFHTAEEESPWVELDLGETKTFDKVRVENRADCCGERADPLIIETSSDQKRWKRASRHEGEFTVWEAEFKPIRARYVRVRLQKRGFLHLAGVDVR